MPEPNEKSFKLDLNIDPVDSSSTNKNHQSYLWCKCNKDNEDTDRCKAYNICRINYNNNNIDNKTNTYSSINNIDKEIYENCVNAFPNFPKYLD